MTDTEPMVDLDPEAMALSVADFNALPPDAQATADLDAMYARRLTELRESTYQTDSQRSGRQFSDDWPV